MRLLTILLLLFTSLAAIAQQSKVPGPMAKTFQLHPGQNYFGQLAESPKGIKQTFLITSRHPVTAALIPREMVSNIKDAKQLVGAEGVCVVRDTKSASLSCPMRYDYIVILNSKFNDATDVRVLVLSSAD